MSKVAAGIAAITLWRDYMQRSGYTGLPTDAQIVTIAEAPSGWATRVPNHAQWERQIEHLLKQVRFGVRDPNIAVSNMDDDLLRPPRVNPAPDPQGSAEDGQPDLLDALYTWLEEQVTAAIPGADRIPEFTLNGIVEYNLTTADEIRRNLSPAAAHLAEQLAGVVARHSTPAPQPPAPAPAPVVQPAPMPERPTPAPSTDPTEYALSHEDFCKYEFGDQEEPLSASLRPQGEGYQLSWPSHHAPHARTVLYRVVSSDGYPPHKPEVGDLVAVTEQLSVRDARPLSAAIRYYQIWCHAGDDLDDARQQQPIRHAETRVVAPVDSFELHFSNGEVVGRWNAKRGTRQVHAFRFPADGHAQPRNDPSFAIPVERGNRGFIDTTVVGGTKYIYRVVAEVDATGSGHQQLSAPKHAEISVPADLQAVELEVSVTEEAGGRRSAQIEWVLPAVGNVEVYLTEEEPQAGLGGELVAVSALPGAGLPERARSVRFTSDGDQPNTHRLVESLPADWAQVCFTPVTVLDDSARVGATVTHTRPPQPVTDPVITERFHRQSLTFGWPAGASKVYVYVGHPDVDAEGAIQGHPAEEISRERYERDGGVLFRNTLSAVGCLVHAVPVVVRAGKEIRGETRSVAYPGLTRVWYHISVPPAPDANRRRPPNQAPQPPTELIVQVKSEQSLEQGASFSLVFNRTRLPLHQFDGDALPMTIEGVRQPVPAINPGRLQANVASAPMRADIAGRQGYIRLFMRMAVASGPSGLVDPDVRSLIVGWAPQ